MGSIGELLAGRDTAGVTPAAEGTALAARLKDACALDVYPRSIAVAGRRLYFLGRRGTGKLLGVLFPDGASPLRGKQEKIEIDGLAFNLALGPTTHENAIVLRRELPYTAPGLVGSGASFGLGDRLGLATPGHVRAIRRGRLVPVFAQQSMREMQRTGRTPREVVDDASWGVFQEGFCEPWGADADHLKTIEDIDRCLDAGFGFFTFDPSGHVTAARELESVPWDALETNLSDARRLYLGRHDLEGGSAVEIDETSLLRAYAGYGRALVHIVEMQRYLAGRMNGRPFEIEVSVDESEAETSIEEHFIVASELGRLGIELASLAPRYPGRFEKGCDYIGDLGRFEQSFALHVAVARTLGSYKLGVHSGSDKFRLYPSMARLADGRLHVKTAGTSYLEALRVIAVVDPDLFVEIFEFARRRYPDDKASYKVSADPARLPALHEMKSADLPGLLDDLDARQLLHVTFGSVLTAPAQAGESLKERILECLRTDEENYYSALEAHFERHLLPLAC
ncbi:MAG TPA: tagaturonate epimerase family protein [Myxococcota bacterium]|nr:tagaturonate epimerase family protein [Myxococcota bacterium]